MFPLCSEPRLNPPWLDMAIHNTVLLNRSDTSRALCPDEEKCRFRWKEIKWQLNKSCFYKIKYIYPIELKIWARRWNQIVNLRLLLATGLTFMGTKWSSLDSSTCWVHTVNEAMKKNGESSITLASSSGMRSQLAWRQYETHKPFWY